MPTRPTISIITPTYNRCHVLGRAIQSVLRQTRGDFEYLIVDDASTDGTRRLVESITDHRVQYHRLARWQGANVARNRGIEQARGRWITFLDSDDEFLPQRIESTLAQAESDSAEELLLSSFQTCKEGRLHEDTNPKVTLSAPLLERALMSYAVKIAGSAITVRRDLLIEADGFAPSLGRMQDRELLLRLSQFTGATLREEIDWVKYPSPDSISGSDAGYVEALRDILELHGDLAARYRDLLSYHLARHLLRASLGGQVGVVRNSWHVSRSAHLLRFGLAELVGGYRHGKRVRRKVAEEMKRLADEQELRENILPLPRAMNPSLQVRHAA